MPEPTRSSSLVPARSYRPDRARPSLLPLTRLAEDLALRDLSDPGAGAHAIQRIVEDAVGALARGWPVQVRTVRDRPVVSIEDHYDRLGYPPSAIAREARYTRYVSDTTMLRAHTSAMVPPALRSLAAEQRPRATPDGGLGAAPGPDDVLLACAGVVYRRDSIDRLHTGTPHQLDLWRVRRGGALGVDDLARMIELVVGATVPGRPWRAVPVEHPYTRHGCQIDVSDGPPGNEEWIEIGECGVASSHVLADAGLDPADGWTGLAMGLGLDRLVMLRKGLPDIRLLRSTNPRIADQLLDLGPWRPVSTRPAIVRDVSVLVRTDETPESLGDQVREALGPSAIGVEAVTVVSESTLSELPEAALARLGVEPHGRPDHLGLKNVLLRIVLRHPDRTLLKEEANVLRDRIVAALHRGGPIRTRS